MMPSIKQYYSRIFCQALSAEEQILAVGNSEGNIIVFDLNHLANLQDGIGREKLHSPKYIVSEHTDSIYSMASSPDFLITGATGTISGWNWKELANGPGKQSWSINLECDQSNFGTPEVNSLAYDSDKNYVYAACGDWRTRGFDLETGKQIMLFEGHENYVHDVVFSGGQVTTCSEDGQVLLWDPRASKEPKVRLKPYTQTALQRPHLGKFISSVDVENDWLICGGGPQAGVFHMRSLALTAAMPTSKGAITVTKFTRHGAHRGSLVIAGNEPMVKVCSISGDVTAEIGTSSRFVYSVHIAEHPIMLMTIGGAGPQLDVCFNLNYRDHSVSTFTG